MVHGTWNLPCSCPMALILINLAAGSLFSFFKLPIVFTESTARISILQTTLRSYGITSPSYSPTFSLAPVAAEFPLMALRSRRSCACLGQITGAETKYYSERMILKAWHVEAIQKVWISLLGTCQGKISLNTQTCLSIQCGGQASFP